MTLRKFREERGKCKEEETFGFPRHRTWTPKVCIGKRELQKLDELCICWAGEILLSLLNVFQIHANHLCMYIHTNISVHSQPAYVCATYAPSFICITDTPASLRRNSRFFLAIFLLNKLLFREECGYRYVHLYLNVCVCVHTHVYIYI